MQCANCGRENADDAKFCSHCGKPMRYPCPVCGVMADPEDRFCRNCGNPLKGEDSPTKPETPDQRPADDLSRYLPEELLAKMRSAREGHAMEGERRTVTMLFADVQGSTASAEQLDPEDWAEIMNGAFEKLIAPIYRYEGTLAQLRGDAVLAFFGAPIAHEDDPVRAIRSGLEIVDAMAKYSETVEERWGLPAHVRVGINTGLVVVGAMGSDLRVEYTALGDAINVAARMEQTAEADTVRVTAHTLSLTNGVFEAEELGAIDVKGKSDPVPSFRVLRYRGRAAHEGASPIVGRSAELATLDEARSAVLDGSGKIVSVIADAGVGKSRIVEEFTTRCANAIDLARRYDHAGEANWLTAASRSYDSARPYSTIADLLRGWWFADRTETDFAVVEQAVAAEGIDSPDVAPFLGFIAGVRLTGEATGFIESLQTHVLNSKASAAVVEYLSAVVGRRPTILVLEDLHWSDDPSLALIEEMMTLTETSPLGMLLVMRPYRDEPSWRLHEIAQRDHPHRYIRLSVEPLDAQTAAELLDVLLEETDIDSRTREGILDRSEGNPLYIEQIARAVADLKTSGMDESHVPSSLRGLLTARLDRLGEEQRYLVQTASVLGSEFDQGALEALVGTTGIEDTLSQLLRAGILVEKPGGTRSLGFRHALIQEAAYETILRRTRRDLHHRVADHLINGDGESAAIAHHLMAADDMQAAYPYLVTAGVAATRSMALADAIELLRTAIENTPDDADPELIVVAHDTIGDAYALIPDLSQAAASYQRLYEYGENNQRPDAQVAALNRLAYATASIGADLESAGKYLQDARRIAEENDDELGLAEYHMNACFVASMGGQLGKAAEHDEETVRIASESGVGAMRLMGMVRRATNYVGLLDWERGMPAVESAIEEAQEVGHEEALATVRLTGSAAALLMRGDISRALAEAEEALATLERYGSFFIGVGHGYLATCHFELGSIETALSQYVEVTRTGAAYNQPFTAAAGYSGMARVYASAGMVNQIPELASEAIERVDGPIGEFMASTVLADLGFTDLARNAPEEAVERFSRGLETSSSTQYMEKPRLLVGRTLARLETDDIAGASSDLSEAVTITEAKGLGLYAARVALAEGLLAIKTQDSAGADRTLTKAHEEAMSRGQRLTAMEILIARAQLATTSGDLEQAEDFTSKALSMVKSIAAEIADESLRDSFTRTWVAALGAAAVEGTTA